MICKHNPRWLHVSRLKVQLLLSLEIFNDNKTCSLEPGEGTDIWLVVEPHLYHSLNNLFFFILIGQPSFPEWVGQ
jgi:hypothetical protein